MKIRYQREIRHNYLVIEMEQDRESYEIRMAEENRIPGFLPFQIKEVGKKRECCYEITSRQPLSRMVERREMKGDELRHLILCIAAAAEEMGKFLLSEEHILLEPDFIYVEPQNFAVSLCFVPEYSSSFPEAVSRLMEYLLGKISHEDREGVVLAYELLQVTKRENYGVRDLLRTLYQPAVSGSFRRSRGEAEGDGYPAGQDGVWGYEDEEEEDLAESRGEREKKGLWGRLKKKRREEEPWKMTFPDEEEERRPESRQRNAGQGGMHSCERWPGGRSGGDQWVADPPAHYEVFARQGEDGRKDGTDLPEEGERKLAELTGDGVITVAWFPFLIGKQEGLVDCVLPRDTVSRLHARIDREGDGYTVTDLNSTNGVRVEGRLLQTNETVPLPVGSEIYFADMGFLFL